MWKSGKGATTRAPVGADKIPIPTPGMDLEEATGRLGAGRASNTVSNVNTNTYTNTNTNINTNNNTDTNTNTWGGLE